MTDTANTDAISAALYKIIKVGMYIVQHTISKAKI